MNKHTPGPWKINWGAYQDGEGHTVIDSRDQCALSIVASIHFHDDEDGETKANARLIAAAPELLEALRGLVGQADAQFKVGDRHATFNKQTIDTARAAIAKAEGKA